MARRPATGRRDQVIGPLTTAGLGCLVLSTVAYVAGWRLGWIELLVVAAGCIAALVFAVPFVIGRSSLRVERSFAPDRVGVGQPVDVELTITNTGRARTRRVEIEEQIGSVSLLVTIPSLPSGATHVAGYALDTSHRSRLDVGPAAVSRADPLGLLRRQVAQSTADVCWVYPATRHLAPLPVGFAKDLEGPTSDTSPAGDVAFHAIRPYVTGDDRRHIHWMSTAKTGSLMVRQYVDNRRPHLAVLVDPDIASHDAEHFETAMSVAASLVVSMLHQQLPVSLRIGAKTIVGRHAPGDADTALEALTLCRPEPFGATDLLTSEAEYLRTEPAASALVLVTGRRPAEELLPTVLHGRRHARIVAVPCAAEGEGVVALPGARTMPVSSLDQFVLAWSAVAR